MADNDTPTIIVILVDERKVVPAGAAEPPAEHVVAMYERHVVMKEMPDPRLILGNRSVKVGTS
ncbi:hypothetical protein GOB57_09335 [Sinorhizobium meliloti]|nr:hypothetical protein [Sinorhizobium meliloti]